MAEGSVLFADISGFTPLTEAYEAHLGARKGGEELARVLNRVYAALIGAVDACGGSVIGFAGDAITCWFDRDDGLVAVHCALSMQEEMKAFAAIPSPGRGTIALGLKAAVSTGRVRRFAVGKEEIQRVDVLAGDPVYRVAQAEQVSSRGEVVVDRKARESIGNRIDLDGERGGEGEPPVAWVVRSATEPAEVRSWQPLESLPVNRPMVDPWVIDSIRERLASGLGEFFTELRPATALFLKFDGIDFETDPEADEKLHRFFSGMQEIVAGYEGILHQLTVGDKGSFLYAAFGAPVSHEDDTLRAMATALKAREFAGKLDFITQVRMGIGRGTTRTGAYGGPSRRTYGGLGGQVNLAARLMGKAAPNQILVSEAAAREGERSYFLQHLDPIRVKGKSHPVEVYALEGTRKDRRVGGSGYAIPMVGRREELNRIGEIIHQVKDGYGQVVSIVGEAGMGKSRLVEESLNLAWMYGMHTFYGECQTFGTNTAYTPWWPVWREYFGLRGDETAETVQQEVREQLLDINLNLAIRTPLLGPVLNISLPDNDLTRTFDAKLRRASLDSLLVECLRARAARHPLVIVLEDVHVIDSVSRDLVNTIVQAMARLPVLLLLVHRDVKEGTILGPEEAALDYTHTIRLDEFSAAESAELIRRKLAQFLGPQAPVRQEVVDHITERTGGNPFFIEEVMNWMHHQKIDINSDDALKAEELPVSLYSLVLSRMDQLDESSRATMKVASVIGRNFRAAVVWGVYPELGGQAPVREALNRLSQREFTERKEDEPELAYLFRHVVIHEVAYESLPHQFRANLHESIGNFLEQNFPNETTQVLDLLAFHFGRSENEAKKREYFLKAGDAARTVYANSAAAGYYEAVLPLLDKSAQIPVLQNLGKVKELAGNWKEAMQYYRRALDLSKGYHNPLESAFAHLHIGDLLRKQGEFEEARNWLNEAEMEFDNLGDEKGIGQVLHSAGTLCAQTGDYDQARELYTKSMEIRRRLGDELKAASLLSNIGIIVRFQGDLDAALRLQEESLAIRRRLNDPWAIGNSLNNLGMAKRYKGDLAGARKDLEEALRLLEKVGDRSEVANTLNSLAEVALDMEDGDACENYLQESLRLSREMGNMRALAFLFEAFASNAFFQKRPERCLRLFGASRALRQRIGAPLPEADEARIEETIDLARQALHEGEPEAELSAGAAFSLSQALDYAAGQ